MNTSRITKRQSSYSTSLYIYIRIKIHWGPCWRRISAQSNGPAAWFGCTVLSRKKAEDSGDSEQGKHVETARFGYFLTILCQILYEHFMFMKIYEDLHRFIICGYRLLV